MMQSRQPTAEHVRTAVVAAARLTGEDPMAVFDGEGAPRARALAYAALAEVFPDQRMATTAVQMSYPSANHAAAALHSARATSWWNEAWLDDVVGALVADRYGARAR